MRWEDMPKKSPRKLKEQIEKGLTCALDGCERPLTQKTGPGSDRLCREHQKMQKEFNGLGRLDRPWTFHRRWECDECGRNMLDEVRKKYPELEEENEEMFYRVARNRIIGDHQQRKAHGGDHSKDNIRSLCIECNADKTIINEDWRN